MAADALDLDRLSRNELIARAQRLGVQRAELMTRVELRDEIVRLTVSDEGRRRKARGWLGVARDLVASVVDKGLHLPEAAALIRGDRMVGFPTHGPRPVATVTLAEIYAAQGHVARAAGLLDEVLAREPDHEAARQLYDRLHQELERRPAARASRREPIEDEEEEFTPNEPPAVVSEEPTLTLPTAEPEPPIAEPEPPIAEPEPPTAEAEPPIAEPEPLRAPADAPIPEAAEEPIAEPEPLHVPEPEPLQAADVAAEPASSEAVAAEPEPTETVMAEPASSEAVIAEPASSEAVAAEPEPSETAPAVEAPKPAVEPESAPFEPEPSEPQAPIETPVIDDALITMSRAGKLYVYWELRPETFQAMLSRTKDARAVVRVVGFVPSWDGAQRIDHDVDVTAGIGSATLSEFGDKAIVRAALGCRSSSGFRAILVGVELAPPSNGDVTAEPELVFRPFGLDEQRARVRARASQRAIAKLTSLA